MRVTIDGREYSVESEARDGLVSYLHTAAIAEYDKLESHWRLMAKQLAREVLRRMETSARARGAGDAALCFRPAKHHDPVLHLLTLLFHNLLGEVMKHVTVNVQTDATSITGITWANENKSETGGQVALNGHIGERKDDGVKVS